MIVIVVAGYLWTFKVQFWQMSLDSRVLQAYGQALFTFFLPVSRSLVDLRQSLVNETIR